MPFDAVYRPLLSILSRIEHRQDHNTTLRRGAVARTAARESRAGAWWGEEPRWYPGGTPPRMHNQVTPLVDGERFFTALRAALQTAQEYVHVIGWCLTPYIPLGRESEAALQSTRLLPLLSGVAQRLPVRILLWSGSPAVLKPTLRDTQAVQEAIARDGSGDIRCHLDHSAHLSHCHHQKAIVIDSQVAFVGGMDLTTFSGDRWDTPQHALRAGQNWHDVQLQIRGEAVADVEHNFRQRWSAMVTRNGGEGGERGDRADILTPECAPYFEEKWRLPLQILRTIPAKVYDFAPSGEFGIYYWYMQAIRRAKQLIYIENQYIWSPQVTKALVDAINAPHQEAFRIVIVLPAFADDGRWDNDKHVQILRQTDRGRGIVSIYSLYTSGPNQGECPFTYRAIYVHAKVAVIDDEWLIAGSANLNDRGLVTDGEICAVVHDPGTARQVRLDLWAEHLELPRQVVAEGDAADLVDREWANRAARNARLSKPVRSHWSARCTATK